MGNTVENLLHEEIAVEFEKLSKLEPGTAEHEKAVNSLSKLVDKAMEMEKFNVEYEEKQVQADEDRKDRIIKNVLTGLGIILPIGVTIWGTNKTLKFEETGTVTTLMGRGFINKLLPKK